MQRGSPVVTCGSDLFAEGELGLKVTHGLLPALHLGVVRRCQEPAGKDLFAKTGLRGVQQLEQRTFAE